MFLSQIFEMEILMDLDILRLPEFENHIFSVWSVCMSVCVRVSVCPCICVSVCESLCVCLSVISITQKQITAESSNLTFYVSIICRCYLKLFIKIGQKLCEEGHTKEFLFIKTYGRYFVIVNFCIFRLR